LVRELFPFPPDAFLLEQNPAHEGGHDKRQPEQCSDAELRARHG
jgi:hypothetical protein